MSVHEPPEYARLVVTFIATSIGVIGWSRPDDQSAVIKSGLWSRLEVIFFGRDASHYIFVFVLMSPSLALVDEK